MYRQYSLLFILPLFFTAALLCLMNNDRKPAGSATINQVIGDESYIRAYGEKPANDVPDPVRIRIHLEYVEDILRNRPSNHLTDSQKQNREKYLGLLRDYTELNKFPHNDGHPDDRRPTFISEDGRICAVGYLVEQTAGRKLAEVISLDYKYAYIPEIRHPQFLKWVEQSGFSMEELAMIQPMYGTIITEEKKVNVNKPGVPFSFGSALLGGVNALYFSNASADPWMFNNPVHNHWFGLTTGSASILLGALNMSNTEVYTTPQAMICMGTCSVNEITETNHARTVIAAANIGVGLASVVRAGYHLVNGTGPIEQNPSGLGVRQLIAQPILTSEPVPVLTYTYRF
jgi:hypothetical protein